MAGNVSIFPKIPLRNPGAPSILLFVFVLLVAGCQKTSRTDDPQLKPVQAMLDQQLSPGTSEADVAAYLEKHGYATQTAEKRGTIVATVRMDSGAASPVSARVTFYFDANHKLNTFELQRAPN